MNNLKKCSVNNLHQKIKQELAMFSLQKSVYLDLSLRQSRGKQIPLSAKTQTTKESKNRTSLDDQSKISKKSTRSLQSKLRNHLKIKNNIPEIKPANKKLIKKSHLKSSKFQFSGVLLNNYETVNKPGIKSSKSPSNCESSKADYQLILNKNMRLENKISSQKTLINQLQKIIDSMSS